MAFRTLDGADVAGKRVLLRADLNVPVRDGKITDLTRHRAPVARPSANWSARAPRSSCAAISTGRRASACRRCRWRRWPPRSARCWASACASPRTASACRRNRRSSACAAATCWCWRTPASTPAEENNDPGFAAELAKLADIYVNDAFSAAHRAHASTEGVAHLLPAYAGRLMQAELEALDAALGNPVRPVAAIVGGAKVSTKLDLLGNLRRQGGRPGDRRRHGQHLPGRAGSGGRQLAAGSRDACDRARHPGARQGGRMRGRAAERCRRGRRIEAWRADADGLRRRGARPTR